MREAIDQLDRLMQRLVEADQTGSGLEPLKVAQELGRIRQLIFQTPTVRRAEGGQSHFRCDSCGTIVHDRAQPARCAECGGTKLYAVDLEQPNVESGAG